MSFQQLYFTSCEQGLSGYAGYQFNAVTDGTSAETMRAVETLTSYEPPQSLAYASDPAELERCPVNLCHAPGQTTIAANVQYVGRDSSRRFGNYFAHAIATGGALYADDDGLLPIELWRAPWWNSRPAADLTLPELPGPLDPGPLSRPGIRDFLDRHPHRDRLPELASAASLARSRGDRSALVVAGSSEEAANWFAAVSYLLPPDWVRGLSFSTYSSRPSRSRLHLLGTLPETDLDLGADATEKFYLFDFVDARFTAVQEHPLATLCARIGLLELPALWGWADSFASRRDATLDDWYPVVAAAAALGRIALAERDLDAAADWLQASPALTEAEQQAIARALHSQSATADDHRRVLREVSARTGDTGLWAEVCYELLEPLLLRREDSPTAKTALAPAQMTGLVPAANRVRQQLTAKAEEQLRLSGNPADALHLLDWAGRTGLDIGPDVLTEAGRLLGRLLATDTKSGKKTGRLTPAQREEAVRVADRWPPVREGIASYLTELEPGKAAAAFSGITGELLTDTDIAADSPLRVPYLVHRDLRRGESPAVILGSLANGKLITAADDLLLNMLWPGRAFRLPDAAGVLGEVADPGVLADTLGLLEKVLATKPGRGEYKAYARVCGDLMASPLAGGPELARHPALREISGLYHGSSRASWLPDLLPVIRSVQGRETVPALVLSPEWLAPRVAELPGPTVGDLAEALTRMNAAAIRRYLSLTAAGFQAPTGSAPVHAAALWLVSGQLRPHEADITHVLALAASWWRPDMLRRAVELTADVDVTDAEFFADWIAERRHKWLHKIAKTVRGAAAQVRKLPPGQSPDAG